MDPSLSLHPSGCVFTKSELWLFSNLFTPVLVVAIKYAQSILCKWINYECEKTVVSLKTKLNS